MSDFSNGNQNSVSQELKIAPVPIEEPAGAQRASANGGGVSDSSSISDSNSGWETKTKKPKKERTIWSTVIELLKKDSKALTVTLKKLKITGWADWKKSRPVAGKPGTVTIKVSFKNGIKEDTLRKYESAVADLVQDWNTTKYKIRNVPYNRVALSRALKASGGSYKYKWAGFEDKKKTVSYVMFQNEDGSAVSDKEGAELIALFEAEFEKVEREESHWDACERAGRTITVQDPKKFSGIEHKLKKEIQKNKASEGIESIPEEVRACVVIAGKRFVTDVNGRKSSQMRLTFQEGSSGDQLSDEDYTFYLKQLTRHWAARCATWERVYREKDAQKKAEGKAKEVLTRWVRFLKNKWMLGVLSAAGDIVRSTSSLEEAHDLFLTGIEKQALKDTAADRAKAERKARIQAMLKPKEERKVEQFAGAHSKKVVRDSMDEVYGGAAAKKGKKQKGKKQNKSKKVSLSLVMEELRVDPSDGNAYPRSSFMEVYGELGQEHWEKAHKVVDQKEPEPEVEVMEPVVETPPVAVVDASLKSNPFAALARPRDLTA